MNNHQGLHDLFVYLLKEMHSSEKQIIEHLPQAINSATSNELKMTLANHLDETKRQLIRLESIFSDLGIKASPQFCKGMEAILKEGAEVIKKFSGWTKDAAIIAASQKVEHYEITAYGTLRTFAKYLDFDEKIFNLLQETLDEEGEANKALTEIALGGIDEKAAKAENKTIKKTPKGRRAA